MAVSTACSQVSLHGFDSRRKEGQVCREHLSNEKGGVTGAWEVRRFLHGQTWGFPRVSGPRSLVRVRLRRTHPPLVGSLCPVCQRHGSTTLSRVMLTHVKYINIPAAVTHLQGAVGSGRWEPRAARSRLQWCKASGPAHLHLAFVF